MTNKINIDDEEDKWQNPEQKPDYRRSLLVECNGELIFGVSFERDEWYHDGNKLDKKNITKWKYLKDK